MEKDISNLELLESINRSFSNIENKISNLDSKFTIAELNLTTEIQDLRIDLKSFRKDTEYSVEEIKNDALDLVDTVMSQDKRIEKLENKVFA